MACSRTQTAILIDPVKELVDRDLTLIKQLNLNLKFVANTHVHADHITGSGEIKKRMIMLNMSTQVQEHQQSVQSVISKQSGAKADVYVEDGDVIECGEEVKINVISTPG